MAIDKIRTKEFLAQIEALFAGDLTAGLSLPPGLAATIKDVVLGPALAELRRLVDESRPPVFYLLGRTKHGKSSLINALAGQDVAEVGRSADPCTAAAAAYRVRFPDRYAEWLVYDSRGLFDDLHKPAGATTADAVAQAQAEILERRPDVILHVLSVMEVSSAAPDLRVLQDIQAAVKKRRGGQTPVLSVLTHVDGLGDVTEWPPETHPDKQAAIAEQVGFFTRYGTAAGAHARPIGSLPAYRGCQVDHASCPFLYVLPVNVPAKAKHRWNLDLLVEVIGGQLPHGARLQFYQALQRKELLRLMASELTTKFAAIASGLAAIPDLGLSDIFLLTPLQLLLVATVGGLSCRSVSKETVAEYLAAAGVNVGGAVGLKALAGFLKTFVPGGKVLNALVAGGGTWGLGKSAEAYFFSGEVSPPSQFQGSYQPPVS